MYQPRSIPKTFQKKEEGTPSALTAREQEISPRNDFPTEFLLLYFLLAKRKDG